MAQKKDRVPANQRVPATMDGIETDVLQREYEPQVASEALDMSAMADTTHYATLQGGVSMGPSRVIGGSIFAGTLGAIVIDNVTNKHAALTNFHVACVDSTWHVGDRMVQPSRIDTGVVPADEFGAILRATLSGNIDGGLISIDPAKANSCDIAEIGQVHGTKAATLGMLVRKRGRTTGLTYGSVDGLAATVNVDYGDGIGVRTLSNQVSIKADTTRNPLFSDHGDSGSVIVDGSGFVGRPAVRRRRLRHGRQPDRRGAVRAQYLDVHRQERRQGHQGRPQGLHQGQGVRKESAKDFFKDKEIRKDLLPDNKRFKDVVDRPQKRVGDNLPSRSDPGLARCSLAPSARSDPGPRVDRVRPARHRWTSGSPRLRSSWEH